MGTNKRKSVVVGSILIAMLVMCACMFVGMGHTTQAKAADMELLSMVKVADADGAHYRVGVNTKRRADLTVLVLPAYYDGIPVTEISSGGFMSCTNLTKVVLPSTITVLGTNAF